MILCEATNELPHWVNLLLGSGGGATVAVVGLFLSGKICVRRELDAAIAREERAIKELEEQREVVKKCVDSAQDANNIANEAIGLMRRILVNVEGGRYGTEDAARRDGGKR